MTNSKVHFALSIKPEDYELLKENAKQNRRSVSKFIEYLIDCAIEEIKTNQKEEL